MQLPLKPAASVHQIFALAVLEVVDFLHDLRSRKRERIFGKFAIQLPVLVVSVVVILPLWPSAMRTILKMKGFPSVATHNSQSNPSWLNFIRWTGVVDLILAHVRAGVDSLHEHVAWVIGQHVGEEHARHRGPDLQ